MAQNDDKRILEAFREHVSELAATWYEEDEAKAFRHAAFQLTLPDPNVADAQIIELTAIDKSGDLEIDGYFVDDQDESVLLFQSQGSGSRADEGKVAKFWMAPEEILNALRVESGRNQSVKELSQVLDERLRPRDEDGYTLRLVFAAKSGFEQAAVQFAQPRRQSERTLTLRNGDVVNTSCILELLSERELAQQFEDFRAGFRSMADTTVELTVNESMQYPVEGDQLKSLRITVRTSEIVRLFKNPELGYHLFSLNPRGPLANAKVNKRMERTLNSESGRKQFHLLNNGLCATCDDYTMEGNSLKITNLQIVNGCQTTVTLEKRPLAELEQTLIDIKLAIADRTLAEQIAIASNSQTALKAKDYASFEKQQQTIQREFERDITPPWYYEVKQGYWRLVLSDREKAKFKTGRRKRHIEVQPLAQASLAFLGWPDVALDRVRFVFEGIRNEDERETYDRAFPPSVRARQLLLPWQILDYLERNSQDRLRFSTFHTIWMIADFLRSHYEVTRPQYFSLALTQKLINSIDDWLPSLARIATRACTLAFRKAQSITRSDSMEVRDFFRASSELGPGVHPKTLLQESFIETMEMQVETQSSTDPRTSLPR